MLVITIILLLLSTNAFAITGHFKFEQNNIIDLQIIELNLEKEIADGLIVGGTLKEYHDGLGSKKAISFFIQSQDYDIC